MQSNDHVSAGNNFFYVQLSNPFIALLKLLQDKITSVSFVRLFSIDVAGRNEADCDRKYHRNF